MDKPATEIAACPQGTLPGLGPEVYAKWRASELGRITEGIERRLMLELIGDVRGRRVLEIGCGDGALAVELAARGADIVAIDASPRMIEAARQRARAAGARIELHVAPAHALPAAAAGFDLVVAQTILCFVKDAQPVFAEIARVLRPGGRLVIGELGRWSTWAAERRVRAWLGSPLWRRGFFRSPGDLARLARGAGLVPGPVRGAVYYPRSGRIARWMSPLDAALGRLTRLGAAFLAIAAEKPGA